MPGSVDGPRPPGTVIVQEEYWRHKRVTVRPMTVVEDTPDLLALYAPVGSTFWLGRWDAPHRQDLSLNERVRVYMSDESPVLVEGVTRFHVLTLNSPGAWHSFKLFWDPAWTLLNWYVNLEAPYEHLDRGIIHRDLFLDIVVSPDLTWTWKDADEFDAVCAAGGLTEGERIRVREEGGRMIERINQRQWPFDSVWPDWRPDPAWSSPLMPHDRQLPLPPEE